MPLASKRSPEHMARAYGACCVAGDRLLACDAHGDWGDATVLKKEPSGNGWKLHVTFDGWSSGHDEWITV